MVEGILTSIIAAAIIALATALYRGGYLHVFYDNLMFCIAPSGIHQPSILPQEASALQRYFVRRLLRDQSRFGHHRGQYGKSRDPLYSQIWQPKGSKENLNLKPRMYLTYWPVIVLHSHGLALRSVDLALSGVARLFKDGRIPLHTSAPGPSPTIRKQTWNHRHSMAGAHLLAVGEPNNSITQSVFDLMIDHRNDWQDSSGGWWQTSEKENKPDLWASIYALKLLELVRSTEKSITQLQSALVTSAIQRTITYFEAEWYANHWSEQGKLLAEENLVPMFIDLAPLLAHYSPRLHSECTDAMKQWLSPGGDLSKTYLAVLETQATPLFAEQAYARMAYAFYRSHIETIDWRPLFERAVRSSMHRLFSSELAFLLDLSFAYEVRVERQ